MAERRRRTTRRIGRFLVKMVPGLLKSLATIGTAAMLWVGGGILLHGIEDLGFTTVPHAVHDLAEEIARGFGRMDGVVSWLTNAIAASILGMVIGGVIVVIVRQFTKHPEELIID
jgi:predicted DNA repair protein MutK